MKIIARISYEPMTLLENERKHMPIKSYLRAFALALPATLLTVLSGCSTNTIQPSTGPITFTNMNGSPLATPPTSLAAATSAYLEVNLGNDPQLLGADWTVSCGSEPPPGTPLPPGVVVDDSCGTFTPVHTLGGPVPSYANSAAGYVTVYTAPPAPPAGGVVNLYVKSTADPSRFSSLTLTITGLPVAISFAPAPPSTLAVNSTLPIKAVLTSDYASGGVNWSVACASGDCGSFSSSQTASGVATTYTAPSTVPSGGTITLTATSVTDFTKSVSASIAISPVSISVLPATLSVVAGDAAQLNATVTNDVRNAGVDWTLSCGSAGACGSITPHTASGTAATYTAPSTVPTNGTVTITATATAERTASATATAIVLP